jgi:hypothetical protein
MSDFCHVVDVDYLKFSRLLVPRLRCTYTHIILTVVELS